MGGIPTLKNKEGKHDIAIPTLETYAPGGSEWLAMRAGNTSSGIMTGDGMYLILGDLLRIC